MNTKTILKKIIFLSAFLMLFLCFEQVSIANAGETVRVVLSKGEMISALRDNPVEAGLPYKMKMKVKGSCGEQDVPMTGWAYTALNDNEELEFYVEAYEQPGGAFAGNAIAYHREPDTDPIYPVPPEFIGNRVFACWVFPNFEAPLHAQAGYYFFVNKPLMVQIHNDNMESIISTFLIRYDQNYPEHHFVTFVVLQWNPVSKKYVLYRGAEPIVIKMSLKGVVDGVNSELILGGGLCNGGVDNENFINWKGYYYAGGTDIEGSLNDGTQEGPQSLQFAIGGDANPATVVVCSWSTWKASVDFDVVLVSKPQNLEVFIDLDHVPIKTNIDNVDLIREKAPYDTHPNAETLLPPGTNFTDYPGPFVVKGINRPYSEIVSILTDAERGGPWPKGGNGPDWMQVAAMDVYNASHDVFNCVWEIGTSPKTDSDGSVSTAIPYRVNLRASRFEIVEDDKVKIVEIDSIRFNKNGKDEYGFYSYKDRDALIRHEALHCYHYLPGPDVYDEEEFKRYNDYLYVGSGRLHFSYDGESGGFLKINSAGDYSSTVDMLLAGRSGDGYMHEDQLGNFILNLGSGQLLNPDLPEIDFELNMPRDIPAHQVFVIPKGLYLYNPSTLKEKDLGACNVDIFSDDSIPALISGFNGYYNVTKYCCNIHTPSPSNLEEIWQLLEQGYTELYLWYEILYKEPPVEYDASAFGIMVTQ